MTLLQCKQHPQPNKVQGGPSWATTPAKFAKIFSPKRPICFSAALLLVLFPIISSASSRQKTDIVYMKNGDKITGELQSLDKGQLSIKPDYTTTAFILDWSQVDHIESTQGFLVTDPHGVTYTGALSKGIEKGSLSVINTATTTLPNNSVIEIDELNSTFWKRMRGNVDVGMSFTRSNSQTNLTSDGTLGYQSQNRLFSLSANSQFTTQQKTNNTNEMTAKTSLFQQLRRSNWYGGGLANFLSSSEQKIDLRSTLGLGIANRLIFTNRTDLNVVGGLGYTLERDAADTTATARTHSLDSAFALNYSTFRFDSTTFNTSLWLYPSLTSPGRVRMTLNQDVYYKFFSNLYVSFSFYDNFDNQPVVGAPKNNLGESTAVGWSFH